MKKKRKKKLCGSDLQPPQVFDKFVCVVLFTKSPFEPLVFFTFFQSF